MQRRVPEACSQRFGTEMNAKQLDREMRGEVRDGDERRATRQGDERRGLMCFVCAEGKNDRGKEYIGQKPIRGRRK